MTENHTPKYNFKEHIINLSHSDNFDTAIKEWIQMPGIYKKLYKGTCHCICQRTIKHFYYIYNTSTFKNINVGTGCYKQFNFTIATTKINPFLQDIIIKYARGEYKNIDDLEEYSTDIQKKIEQELTDMYKKIDKDIIKLNTLKKNIDKDIIKLNTLKENIEELIANYNFTCLEDLKNLVIETINVLEEERKLDEETARKRKEYELEKTNETENVKTHFEEGYYNNKKNIDFYTEQRLIDYIKKQNNKYIQTYITIYEENTDLYNKIKYILDYKLNWIEKFRIQAEEKKKKEEELIKQKLETYFEQVKNINLEKYIRIKLGQTYPIPDILYNGYNKGMRFEFHSGDDIENNKYILELFTEDFNDKNVVVHSWKGSLKVFIISNINYEKSKFWNFENTYNFINDTSLIEKFMDLTGFGTVDIIKEIFYYILPQKKEREEKQKIEEKKNIEKYKKYQKFEEEEYTKLCELREYNYKNIYATDRYDIPEYSKDDIPKYSKDDIPKYSKDDIRKYFSKN
jgi:hypothetical protein